MRLGSRLRADSGRPTNRDRRGRHPDARPIAAVSILVRHGELRSTSRHLGGCAIMSQDLIASEEMSMTRAYNVVDADGHILELLDLWR